MSKRKLASAAVAIGVLTLAVGPAHAFGATLLMGAGHANAMSGPPAPVYSTIFYNNAAHQVQVGQLLWQACLYDEFSNWADYRRIGMQTSFYSSELIGYCEEGNYSPA